MRGFGGVFTPPVAYEGIAMACKRNSLTLGLKETNHSSSQLDACHHEEDCHHEEGCQPRRRRACRLVRGVPPPASLWVDTLRSFIVPNEWLTWSLSNMLTGMESCVSSARLFKKSLIDFDGFVVIFPLIHGAIRTWTVEHMYPSIFTAVALCRCSEKGVIFGRNRIQACVVFFGPSDVDLWSSITRAIQESI